VCAIDQYIGLAKRQAGADFYLEIASGGGVKDGKVVSPAINDEDKVAADGWAAGSVGAQTGIGNGSGYGMQAAGAKCRSATDDAVGGVSHGKPGWQTGSHPVQRSRTAGGSQRHSEWYTLPGNRVKRWVDGCDAGRDISYDIEDDSSGVRDSHTGPVPCAKGPAISGGTRRRANAKLGANYPKGKGIEGVSAGIQGRATCKYTGIRVEIYPCWNARPRVHKPKENVLRRVRARTACRGKCGNNKGHAFLQGWRIPNERINVKSSPYRLGVQRHPSYSQ